MRPTLALLALAAAAPSAPAAAQSPATPTMTWPIHAMDRPQPRVVNPGPAPAAPAPVPADAIVLFGGRDLSEWVSQDSAAASSRWAVRDGYFEVVSGTGGIRTRRGFGDVQLHVEWMAPSPPRGTGQDRGNSGVFLMGMYEVQVLDSYENRTYPDGQAAAIYGQYPPLVNASRPPGQWQTYDVVFRRPRFDASGALTAPARLTVIHNGVLVQDAVVLTGPTGHHERPPYAKHDDRLPIGLQDHGHPVRFRNFWVRDLEQ